MNQRNPRLFAFLLTLGFFGFMWLYVQEFPVLSNTIGVVTLALLSMLTGAIVSAGIIWWYRQRFMPWKRHLPELALIVLVAVIFSPLLGSWINRGLGTPGFQSFQFVSETPFFASGYGVLQGEKIKPTGYRLAVQENGKLLKFKYKTQPFYPLTKPGEPVMLPVCQGFFGLRVVTLR